MRSLAWSPFNCVRCPVRDTNVIGNAGEDRIMQRLSAVLAVGVLAAILLIPGLAAGQAPAGSNESLPAVNWELDPLNREPFKLIKASLDPKGSQVRFLIEFTRPPRPTEQADWERHNGVVVFRFMDEDGLVIRSVQPTWEGEFVPKKGARMALVLQMPDAKTLTRTRSIVAE
jgi:hypothetical protein